MRILVFTTCKPWKGLYHQIQDNALRSWKLWDPEPQIVIFGGDVGSKVAALRFDAIHCPDVECLSSGHPTIGAMFTRAETIAADLDIDVLMFANADMVVTGLPIAAQIALDRLGEFLLIAYRRDIKNIDLDRPGWQEHAHQHSTLGPPDAIDLFCFTRELWRKIPRFFSGHVGFDNWLVMNARDRGLPVVDATQVVWAFHQAHPPRLLNRPGDRQNLKVLAQHEGGGSGDWAPRGRLTDATWVMAWDDLEVLQPNAPDQDNSPLVRQIVPMSLCSPVQVEVLPRPRPLQVVEPELAILELPEPHESKPLSDNCDPNKPPPFSARVQRILNRCTG